MTEDELPPEDASQQTDIAPEEPAEEPQMADAPTDIQDPIEPEEPAVEPDEEPSAEPVDPVAAQDFAEWVAAAQSGVTPDGLTWHIAAADETVQVDDDGGCVNIQAGHYVCFDSAGNLVASHPKERFDALYGVEGEA